MKQSQGQDGTLPVTCEEVEEKRIRFWEISVAFPACSPGFRANNLLFNTQSKYKVFIVATDSFHPISKNAPTAQELGINVSQ